MIISTEDERYLNGELVTSGLSFKIAEKGEKLQYRPDLLTEIIKNKKIIHLGCCDHLCNIETKIRTNQWLHGILSESASRCLGIDIDPEAVELLKTKFGYEDIKCINLLEDDNLDDVIKYKWDYLLACDMLEHVDNPVSFLQTLRKKLKGSVDKMIITVPNVQSYWSFYFALKHKEAINSDHRYYFSPYTLAKVITRAGLKLESFSHCEHSDIPVSGLKASLRKLLHKKLVTKFPGLRTTVIAIARF